MISPPTMFPIVTGSGSPATGDLERSEHRRLEPDALENGVSTEAVRELTNTPDRLLAALAAPLEHPPGQQ